MDRGLEKLLTLPPFVPSWAISISNLPAPTPHPLHRQAGAGGSALLSAPCWRERDGLPLKSGRIRKLWPLRNRQSPGPHLGRASLPHQRTRTRLPSAPDIRFCLETSFSVNLEARKGALISPPDPNSQWEQKDRLLGQAGGWRGWVRQRWWAGATGPARCPGGVSGWPLPSPSSLSCFQNRRPQWGRGEPARRRRGHGRRRRAGEAPKAPWAHRLGVCFSQSVRTPHPLTHEGKELWQGAG